MAGEGARRGYGNGLQAGDVSDLSHQLEQIKKKNRLFKKVNFGLAAIVVALISFSFYYFVWSYAVIDEVKITQDSKDPSAVWFDFNVTSGGFLRYGHGQSSSGEPVEKGDKRHFRYQRDAYGKDFTVFVRSRWLIFPSWTTKTFSVSGGS
jgi:hypothetical protein